jgi:hypothetical protein
MNFHSKLVGALEAVILAGAALVTLALLLALMDPIGSHGRLAAAAEEARAAAPLDGDPS